MVRAQHLSTSRSHSWCRRRILPGRIVYKNERSKRFVFVEHSRWLLRSFEREQFLQRTGGPPGSTSCNRPGPKNCPDYWPSTLWSLPADSWGLRLSSAVAANPECHSARSPDRTARRTYCGTRSGLTFQFSLRASISLTAVDW